MSVVIVIHKPAGGNSRFAEGYSGFTEGYSGFAEGNSGFAEGNSGFTEGNPGFTEGNPGFKEGNPGFKEGYSRFAECIIALGEWAKGKTCRLLGAGDRSYRSLKGRKYFSKVYVSRR